MPPAEYAARGAVGANVAGERIVFAQRIYNPEIAASTLATLSPTQQLVAQCAFSRHHDGYVRQGSCERIVGTAQPWVTPYVVYLVGEYVVEITEVIRDRLLGDLEDPESPRGATYGQFAAANPEFVSLVRQRATSYWNCYYRARYPREEYPALVLVDALERAADRTQPRSPL